MEDKCIMENLLVTEKGVCDLYMHGSIESATANVNQTFNKALSDSLLMQSEIYKQMSDKGWYPAQQAQSEQIQQIKQKFSGVAGKA